MALLKSLAEHTYSNIDNDGMKSVEHDPSGSNVNPYNCRTSKEIFRLSKGDILLMKEAKSMKRMD